MPLIMWIGGQSLITGALDSVSYALVCMLPLFLAKFAGVMFVDFTSYKHMSISKQKITQIIDEKEETGSLEPFVPNSFDIAFDKVSFAYVPGEPVLESISFTAKEKQLTAVVGDSGAGKSTVLNLIAK
ncbi:MAG: ATP-binding cassette domain-containing protein [Peptococcaceae bacterium]|nr:ATP-binding cassette domain-containing protein [Peptococcaceae bacterium]